MPLNTPKTFCMKIENIVKEKKITHMDAVLWYCQKEGLELEGISPLISKALKEKIRKQKYKVNFNFKNIYVLLAFLNKAIIISLSISRTVSYVSSPVGLILTVLAPLIIPLTTALNVSF